MQQRGWQLVFACNPMRQSMWGRGGACTCKAPKTLSNRTFIDISGVARLNLKQRLYLIPRREFEMVLVATMPLEQLDQ